MSIVFDLVYWNPRFCFGRRDSRINTAFPHYSKWWLCISGIVSRPADSTAVIIGFICRPIASPSPRTHPRADGNAHRRKSPVTGNRSIDLRADANAHGIKMELVVGYCNFERFP